MPAKGTARDSVLVIGGGVVGLMSAYALARSGMSVSVCDAGAFSQESSWSGGGILSPVPPWKYGDWVEQMVSHSRVLLDQWVPEIEALSGVSCEYRKTGLLLSGDPREIDFVGSAKNWLATTNERFEVGVRADFDVRLPQPNWPALHLPDVAQIRNPRLGQALIGALKTMGVSLMAHQPIHSLTQLSDGGIEVKPMRGNAWAVDQVVLAAGAWTDAILKHSGLDPLGIRPRRGQILLYRLPVCDAPKQIINTGRGYLIPRADGHVLVGSTLEDVGFDYAPTESAHAQLRECAEQIWPALTAERMLYQWTGHRPGLDAEQPAMGQLYQGWPGLWLNAGHFRNGLGLAPACAEKIADWVVQRGQS